MKKVSMLVVLFTIFLPVGSKAQADDAFWWGYYEEPAHTSVVRYLGLGQPDTYDAAILLRRSTAALESATIHGLRFQLRNADNISKVKAWMSHALPATGEDADICTKNIPASELKSLGEGYVEVTFDTSYTLVDSVFLGFTFTVASDADNTGKIPLCCAGMDTHQDAFFFRTYTLLPQWQVLGGQKYGDLMLQALISNANMSQNAVSLNSMTDFNADDTHNGHAAVNLTNNGAKGVKSLTYKLVSDNSNEQSESITYELPAPITGVGVEAEVLLPVVGGSQPTTDDVTLVLQAVNGQPNESGEQSVKAKRTTLLRGAARRVLFEEYTGTWCGWCPRGTVAMEWLSEQMGDDVVLIAVHQGDPMEITDASTSYASMIESNKKGYPKVNVNRGIWCDPYHGTDAGAMTYDNIYVQNDIKRELLFLAEADIALHPVWNADSTSFKAETEITFQYNRDDAPYSLAYVLVADGLKGTTAGWGQANSFAALSNYVDYFTGTPLVSLVEGAETLTGVSYNRVAVAAWSIRNGIANVLSAPLKAGELQTYVFQPIMPTLPLVKDKSPLQLAAILLDTRTGRVVNAAISPFTASEEVPSGISSSRIMDNTSPIFDLQGRRTKTSTSGIYIQQQTDGTTRKVLKR